MGRLIFARADATAATQQRSARDEGHQVRKTFTENPAKNLAAWLVNPPLYSFSTTSDTAGL